MDYIETIPTVNAVDEKLSREVTSTEWFEMTAGLSRAAIKALRETVTFVPTEPPIGHQINRMIGDALGHVNGWSATAIHQLIAEMTEALEREAAQVEEGDSWTPEQWHEWSMENDAAYAANVAMEAEAFSS